MTRLAKTLLESFAVLVVGFAIVGSLMFAFAQNASANQGNAHSVGSKLEVSIADNGKAVVRGAEVTAISGSTITAHTDWGSSTLTWTVRTDGDTDFIRKSGGSSTIGDVSVGDYVSFSGSLVTSENAFTVDADAVKNWSLDDAKAVYAGTVTSVNDDADTFVLKTKQNGDITVKATGDTSYSTNTSFSDVDVNHSVVVSGSYDAGTDTLTASKISLDIRADVKDAVKGNWGDWMKKFPILNWFNKGHK